jgi:hypothetical protein
MEFNASAPESTMYEVAVNRQYMASRGLTTTALAKIREHISRQRQMKIPIVVFLYHEQENVKDSLYTSNKGNKETGSMPDAVPSYAAIIYKPTFYTVNNYFPRKEHLRTSTIPPIHSRIFTTTPPSCP